MDEKRYDIVLEHGLPVVLREKPESIALQPTSEQAHSLRLQCEAIEAQAEMEKVEAKPTAEDYLRGHKGCGIKVGDTVKVLRAAKNHEGGWACCWSRYMDELVGEGFKIMADYETQGFRINEKNGKPWFFPYFVLEKVSEQSWTPTLDNMCEFTESKIDVMKPGPFRVVPRHFPPEPEKRVWRDWDVARWVSGNIYLRRTERWSCVSLVSGNKPMVNATDDEMDSATLLFNLPDLLASGEIIVALTEKEAAYEGNAYQSQKDKITDALAVYRERKGQSK